MRRVLLALLLAALPALARGQEPSAKATASKTDVTVGESFVVEVTAQGPAAAVWSFPVEAGDDKVELRALRTLPSPAPLPPGVLRYEATAFALGEVAVPAIEVPYTLPDGTSGKVATAPIPLRIVSALPKDTAEQTLADIRPPVPLSIGRAFWIALAAAILLLVALGAWLWRRRRPVAEVVVPPQPEIPADSEALQALDRLLASGLLASGEYRPFYIALTELTKRYLERRLRAPVLEMTTSEMLSWMRDAPTVHDRVALVRDLAGAADRIKFARAEGLADEAQRHVAAVRQLITEVETRLRPVVAPVQPARKEVA